MLQSQKLKIAKCRDGINKTYHLNPECEAVIPHLTLTQNPSTCSQWQGHSLHREKDRHNIHSSPDSPSRSNHSNPFAQQSHSMWSLRHLCMQEWVMEVRVEWAVLVELLHSH